MVLESGAIDPKGPVFLSYRHSDGAALAEDMAWALRAVGVPVWHDVTDLPPGDTPRRLAEAITSGLSGAVLLVTPDIEHSEIIREIELPSLLEMSEDPRFAFSIAQAINAADGRLDYDAPDQLLQRTDGILKNHLQSAAFTPQDIAAIAFAHSRRRLEGLSSEIESRDGLTEIDIQTRLTPASTINRNDLVVRLRPPDEGNRRPSSEGLSDLKGFLSRLGGLLDIAGARRVRISGGAHLTAAFALGAALPTTLVGQVEVIDSGGHHWILSGDARLSGDSKRMVKVINRDMAARRGDRSYVYVDLLSERSDEAFYQFANQHGGNTRHIRTVTEGNLDSNDARAIVGEVSQVIRQAATESGISEAHVFLRCPWTVALLLGRTLNTVRIHLYEWEDGRDEDRKAVSPRYVPSLVVRPGAGGGPIEDVVLPSRGAEKIMTAKGG